MLLLSHIQKNKNYFNTISLFSVGKLLATLCVISGVLIITPLLPIVYANYARLYHLDSDPSLESKGNNSSNSDKGTGLLEISGVSESRTP